MTKKEYEITRNKGIITGSIISPLLLKCFRSGHKMIECKSLGYCKTCGKDKHENQCHASN